MVGVEEDDALLRAVEDMSADDGPGRDVAIGGRQAFDSGEPTGVIAVSQSCAAEVEWSSMRVRTSRTGVMLAVALLGKRGRIVPPAARANRRDPSLAVDWVGVPRTCHARN